jgi:hypothetical protein
MLFFIAIHGGLRIIEQRLGTGVLSHHEQRGSLAAYEDFLSQSSGLVRGLFGSDYAGNIELWNAAARKFAEFIAPRPLIEATLRDVKEYYWKAPGPQALRAINILHSQIVALREQERLLAKERKEQPVIDVFGREI